MISSARPEATKIGLEILRSGGNAIDAAVAVGFALGVAEPATSGLGGGGFMTIRSAHDPKIHFIDFREIAPELATPNMWKLTEAKEVHNQENEIGAKSISVPGELKGLEYALEKFGSISLEEAIKPSIDLACKGIIVTDLMEKMLGDYSEHLFKCNEAKRIFSLDGEVYKSGDTFKNPGLVETLKRISTGGSAELYEGITAERIVASIQAKGGILTKKDMSSYEVSTREPVTGTYRGYKIISSPPPSSGGTHIIQSLNILEKFDIGTYEVNSTEYIHLFSEVFKFVYEDRANYMADSDFIEIPLEGLRSKDYANDISKQIDMTHSRRPNCINPWTYEHEDTTHFSIGDTEGNLVSVTKTINHFFGSCMVAKNTGILLNDTMADFSTCKYDVNAPGGGKRPLSTMSPTIILKDDKPFAVIGSPGGERIINAVVQVISKLIDHDMDLYEAVESPRFTQNSTNRLQYESRIEKNIIADLKKMGHELVLCNDFDKKMGGVNAVTYDENGVMTGAADPRRDGEARGL